jgi:hypothetical protein
MTDDHTFELRLPEPPEPPDPGAQVARRQPMIAARSLAMHTAVLVVAGILALRTWTKDEDTSTRHAEAEVWSGSTDKLERITYESEVGTVTLYAPIPIG